MNAVKLKSRGYRFLLLLGLAGLAGCTTSPDRWLLSRYGAQNTLSSFRVCKNYGCAASVMIHLNDGEWAEVRAQFSPVAASTAEEREQVRHAIAMLEMLVGPAAGTSNDKPGADIVTFDREGQLDCIDEAYNTTTYLRLLAVQGLIKWHDVGQPMQRGSFIDRWPHNTATIVERGSGVQYTVDSWFHANGEMPETVLLKDWLAGWSPAKS